MRGQGCLARTIKNRTDEGSDDIVFLSKVQIIWDLRSVEIIRPRLLLRVRHGPEGRTKGRGFSWRAEPETVGRKGRFDARWVVQCSSGKSQLNGDVIGGFPFKVEDKSEGMSYVG